jgi:mRNA-degrading endonuclease RelE of RelBE toxin-antitoxin system
LRVEVARPAQTQLVKLPPDLRLKILRELQNLGEDPFPGPPKSKRLVGFKVPTFRLRIGDYRAVYRIIEDVILILALVARKDLERIIRGLR